MSSNYEGSPDPHVGSVMLVDSTGNAISGTNPLPTSGGGGGGGGAVTVADGADVTLGAKADTAWSSGSGSVIALLKALMGKSTAATVTVADGADVTLGAQADTAWSSGSGSVIALLKALVGKSTAAAVTVADGADVTLGAKADTAWSSGSGSVIALLKALAGLISNQAVAGDTTITAGGTAQNLFSGVTPAHGFAVYNPDPTNDFWVSDSTTALANGSGSIRVAANGGGYETPPGYRPIGAVSVVGAVTGQIVTARSW